MCLQIENVDICSVTERMKSPEKAGDAVDGNGGNQRLASLQKQLDIENKVCTTAF